MPEEWLTIAEAAAVMKIHPRTVERRAAAGKLLSRRNDDGQVQILIDRPELQSASEPVSAEVFETVREMADRQVDIAAGSASALVRAAQEQAMRAENQLAIARQDAGRHRREAQMAMSLVAAMLLSLIVAVGWGAHTMTDAHDRATTAAADARQAIADDNRDREQLAAASSARDKAMGELAAYKSWQAAVVEQARPQPATQPTSFLARLSRAMTGD